MVDMTCMVMLNAVKDKAAEFNVGLACLWEGGDTLEEANFNWLRRAFGGYRNEVGPRVLVASRRLTS